MQNDAETLSEGPFQSLASEQPNNLTGECVVRILTLIKEGKLKVGDRVGELSIANEIKMGRAPTRSALDRLAQVGVLERIPRSGTFVKELSLKEYSEIMDLRAYIECLSARLAAQRIEEKDGIRLVEAACQVDAINQSDSGIPLQERCQKDMAFHLVVARIGGNQRLYAMLQGQHLLEFSFITGCRLLPKGREGMFSRVPTHENIARAIAEHRVEDAGTLMRDHVLGAKQVHLSMALGEA